MPNTLCDGHIPSETAVSIVKWLLSPASGRQHYRAKYLAKNFTSSAYWIIDKFLEAMRGSEDNDPNIRFEDGVWQIIYSVKGKQLEFNHSIPEVFVNRADLLKAIEIWELCRAVRYITSE